MKISQIYDLHQKSKLPPGGSPATDDAFMAWARDLCERRNAEWLDRFEPHELPKRDLIVVWQLVNHLFKWAIGWPFPSGEGPNQNHRLRFLSSYFRVRPGLFQAEAHRYIDELEAGNARDGADLNDLRS